MVRESIKVALRQKNSWLPAEEGLLSFAQPMTTSSGTIGTILHHKGARVWTISPQATVFDAIKLLADKNIGALPVVEGDTLIGIFSERDYTRKVALEGKTSHATRVKEIISTKVTTITPHDTVEDAMRLMTEKHIRHLPVMEDGRMVGFISIGDMVNCIISAQSAAIDQMEAYMAGR
jgi:CBS domain-containing protein